MLDVLMYLLQHHVGEERQIPDDEEQLIDHLEESGFEILELCANGNFFDYLWQEVRRAKRRAKQYADAHPNFFERLAIRVVLQMLRRFSSKDKGSDELLCFGYHVLARKGA